MVLHQKSEKLKTPELIITQQLKREGEEDES